MADKANGQARATAPKKGLSKIEAVRRALAHFGNEAKPSAMQPWIKQQFGIDMSPNHISASRGDILKKASKANATAPAAKTTATSSPATPKPAVPAAKKPTAPKAAPKKPSAAKPQAQQVAARSNLPPKGGNAGRGISLDDIQAVKGLVRRVGTEQLRSLIDLLAK